VAWPLGDGRRRQYGRWGVCYDSQRKTDGGACLSMHHTFGALSLTYHFDSPYHALSPRMREVWAGDSHGVQLRCGVGRIRLATAAVAWGSYLMVAAWGVSWSSSPRMGTLFPIARTDQAIRDGLGPSQAGGGSVGPGGVHCHHIIISDNHEEVGWARRVCAHGCQRRLIRCKRIYNF
jgi:hypothetical protein